MWGRETPSLGVLSKTGETILPSQTSFGRPQGKGQGPNLSFPSTWGPVGVLYDRIERGLWSNLHLPKFERSEV